VIGGGGVAPTLTESIRLMRRHCVRFLDRVGATQPTYRGDSNRHLFRDRRWQMHDYWFGEALGELRSSIGLQVALLAAAYGLEDDLAQTLPDPTEE
jgi:hypothetical protein